MYGDTSVAKNITFHISLLWLIKRLLCPKFHLAKVCLLPSPEHVLQVGRGESCLVLSDILCVIHASPQHLTQVSQERGHVARQVAIETVIEKEQVHWCIVKHHWCAACDQVGKQLTQGLLVLVFWLKTRKNQVSFIMPNMFRYLFYLYFSTIVYAPGNELIFENVNRFNDCYFKSSTMVFSESSYCSLKVDTCQHSQT